MSKITFTDGYEISVPLISEMLPALNTYYNACPIWRDGSGTNHSLWTGSKTDTYGNVWTIGGGTLTITKTGQSTITRSMYGTGRGMLLVYISVSGYIYINTYCDTPNYCYIDGYNDRGEDFYTHYYVGNISPVVNIIGGHAVYWYDGSRWGLGGSGLDPARFQIEPGSVPRPDPYTPGGTSEEGGGTGNFDGTGDHIQIPGLPSISAVDTGFITLFNPTLGQLKNLANYMWSSGFDLDTFKKLFADPMNCILGLSIVPVAVPNGGAVNVTVGNISTGVSMTLASTQYVAVDCGTLNVNEYWGAYLDYDPFTKAEIYLPYIGTHPIAVDDIMNKSVHVVYHVDILSGACVAFVQCDGTVLYSFIGQCSSSIPITGNDWTNVINGVLSIAGSIGSMVATSGASFPKEVSKIASAAVNNSKPNIEKSGSLSGTGGMLGIQTPYLILTRPRQALPARQSHYTGYPSFITEKLSNLSGYTEIYSVHLEGIPATKDEISEIESLLKSGVIF